MAGQRPPPLRSARPLNDTQQSSRRERPLPIDEPPLSTEDRSAVPDPLRPVAKGGYTATKTANPSAVIDRKPSSDD
jgi:hypothetical protein